MFVFRLPQGTYQEKPKLPFVPGSEVSGVVTEVADDVHSVKVRNLDREKQVLSVVARRPWSRQCAVFPPEVLGGCVLVRLCVCARRL